MLRGGGQDASGRAARDSARECEKKIVRSIVRERARSMRTHTHTHVPSALRALSTGASAICYGHEVEESFFHFFEKFFPPPIIFFLVLARVCLRQARVRSSPAAMKLTPELVDSAPVRINPLRERELVLRGA